MRSLVLKFEKCGCITNHTLDCRLVRDTKHTADNLRFIRRARLSLCTLMQIFAVIGTGGNMPTSQPKLKSTASLALIHYVQSSKCEN